MMTETQVNIIRIAMILIDAPEISIGLKKEKLYEVAGILDLKAYGGKYYSEFMIESLKLIKSSKILEWKRFLRKVLEFVEEYEAIVALHLN